jgi:hypothetical protein
MIALGVCCAAGTGECVFGAGLLKPSTSPVLGVSTAVLNVVELAGVDFLMLGGNGTGLLIGVACAVIGWVMR